MFFPCIFSGTFIALSLSMELITRDYVAGLFDGEGCVNIGQGKHKSGRVFTQLKCLITNTNEEIIKDFQAQLGARINVWKDPKPERNNKVVYKAIWQGVSAINFLVWIYPKLRIKGRQANLAFEFWDFYSQNRSKKCERIKGTVRATRRTKTYREKEYAFYLAMKALNKKGRA